MKITESQLRRIIRQEVQALHEAPRRAAVAAARLSRGWKLPSPGGDGGPSVDGYELRMFRQAMQKIADMLGAPDANGLRVSEDPSLPGQVRVDTGSEVELDRGGWMIARTGTLNGEPVVVVADGQEGLVSVYKYVG